MSQTVSTFAFLFPGNAMINSLLATSYISIIPNLLLYFVPPDIKSSTLNTLVNFAVGSLLGDVFLHLLPHAFHSHDHHESPNHQHEDNERKNVLIGLGLFAGIFIFYAADKCMRAYLGKTGHDHDHAKPVEQVVDQVAVKTPSKKEGLRQRHVVACTKKQDDKQDPKPIRASTYLNLLADFTHNLTDGIAMAASFYASPAVGATTAVAVFFHEIPHEVSDYAILLKSGFTKKRAMMAQFTTAIGAYMGTLIGISIEEMAIRLSKHEKGHHHHHHGLWQTSMTWSDLVIPVTAGGFLYIATVGVIPELLEAKPTNKLQPIKELVAMVFGIGLMVMIALNETHHH
ncbi:Zinc/iron permease [Gilbertella persicaria]|uniref:Zinc/iron permease n=1 Tax=Gilbertella persicaria TaxID=101096 RepID=UPI00221F32D3|nr:Zinc/iron permease [Gilbertella persicaria]KAI8074280.1 Zinc/iron permease [Gilbertella persicaria]